MSKGYYLIRAMSQSQDDFDIFFNKNVVAVGWSDVNFCEYDDVELLVNDVYAEYYKDDKSAPQVIGKKRNEVRRFKEIKQGDRLVIPSWGSICLAEAEADEFYSTQDSKCDLANQRKVAYHRDQNGNIIYIPRVNLSEGLQRRLRVRGTTISDLWEFIDEIDSLFKGQDFNSRYNKSSRDAIDNFKNNLLENIQSGKTNLDAGGYGLEKLVQELLEIEGFKAEIQPKQRFPGFADADIEANKEDFLSEHKLLVQVKHHSGITGTWGAEQLVEILKLKSDLFSEYRLVLITSAIPSKDLMKICEMNDIVLVSGNDLSEWIFKSLRKLKNDTKKKLGISDVPTLLI